MQCYDLEQTIQKTIFNALQSNFKDNTVPTAFVKKGNTYELSHYVGTMKPENIHITEHKGYVTIQGHNTATDQDGSYCSYSFTQHAPLPSDIPLKKIVSTVENGTIKLTLRP